RSPSASSISWLRGSIMWTLLGLKKCAREALLELVQNTYMNWLLDRDQRAAEFEVLCKIVQQVPVRRIIPHADPARLGALCDLILQNATDHPDHARQAPASVP